MATALMAQHGLRDWTFGFNRRKRAMDLAGSSQAPVRNDSQGNSATDTGRRPQAAERCGAAGPAGSRSYRLSALTHPCHANRGIAVAALHRAPPQQHHEIAGMQHLACVGGADRRLQPILALHSDSHSGIWFRRQISSADRDGYELSCQTPRRSRTAARPTAPAGSTTSPNSR